MCAYNGMMIVIINGRNGSIGYTVCEMTGKIVHDADGFNNETGAYADAMAWIDAQATA